MPPASERRTANGAALPRLERRVDERSHRRFLEVTGRRLALLGNELGVFEAWIWPIKVLRELEVCVRTDQLRRGRDLARSVAFQPDRTEVELVGPGFRVRETLFAALDRRALVVLLEVECERDLELEVHFVPWFTPMWPAGLGGQIALRDDETGAFALTEELGRFAALLGSPEAEPLVVTADHAAPRERVALRIPVSAARAKRGPIPFFLVGAQLDSAELTEAARAGERDAAKGHSRAHDVLALAREEYRWIARDWPQVARDLEENWRDFLARTTHFESDDARHTEAYLWAKIAIEKAWVEVDGLGRGLVAGLAPSGESDRPGFGWFFDGDALVASRAMSGYGDWKGARRVLDFAASHQRRDGKMMHELVLSARLCNWFEDYPYAYYKAQLTPGFISCLDHYFAWSGDREFLQQMWPAALAAYRCCLANLEEDGLLSNRKLGLAAVEAGALVGRIRSDIYLHGIWLSALRAIASAARLQQDSELERDALARLDSAQKLFEGFWSEERQSYGFAQLVDGSRCDDSTSYQALPLSRRFGQDERALASAAALNRPALASDWGTRFFASDSSTYDPSNYNTGSVFPYANNFAILAQFAHGLTSSGHQLLASQVALHGFSGLGFVPEHLYGDRCETPPRGVPHQIFSSACILQSTLFGMLGLQPRSLDRFLALVPSFQPKGARVRVERLRVGESVVAITLERERSGGRTRIRARFELTSGPPLRCAFGPLVPPMSRDARVSATGTREFEASFVRRGAALLAICVPPWVAQSQRFPEELSGRLEIELSFEAGPELLLDDSPLVEGSVSSRMRACEVEHDEQSVMWTVWGLAEQTYRIGVRSDRRVEFEGARRIADDALEITFPAGANGTFVESRIRAVARD